MTKSAFIKEVHDAEQYNLIPDLNVYDNITFPLELDGTQIDKDFIRELLETLNISDKQEMLPAMLSGGEQQRVAIIRALATKPAIILADDCDIIGLTRKNPIKSRVLSC